MTTCPLCGCENIRGSDDCAECGQPLADTHLAPPANEVERSLLGDRIGVLDPKTPVTVEAAMPLADVLRLMVERRIGCVVVVDGERPVGIFSERDALHRVGAQAGEFGQRPVGDFMTANPQSLVADAKLAFAVHRMDLGGYRHLPIVDAGGDVVGIISARDILRHLTEVLSR